MSVSNNLNQLLQNVISTSLPANEQYVSSFLSNINFSLPTDYIKLIKKYNGGEGELGKNGWLCLFAIEDLIEINHDYALLMEQIPDYFLFGKDAADTGYAFHKFNHTFHSFGLMSNFKTDTITYCGDNMLQFVEYLITID